MKCNEKKRNYEVTCLSYRYFTIFVFYLRYMHLDIQLSFLQDCFRLQNPDIQKLYCNLAYSRSAIFSTGRRNVRNMYIYLTGGADTNETLA